MIHALDDESRDLRAKTSLEGVCRKVAGDLRHRGVVCLVSDLFVEEDGLMRGLRLLAHRGHDVLVFHVMDDDELAFPFDGNVLFQGLESSGRALVQPQALRDGYLEAVARFVDGVRRACVRDRIQYRLVNTSENLGAVLAEFLAAASAVRRAGATKRR
jgi:hypothetical protein